jgi:spore coat protein A
MDLKDRRAFLKLCLQSFPVVAMAGRVPAQAIKGTPSQRIADRVPPPLDKFIDPLPIPKRLTPYDTHHGKSLYRVRMVEFTQKLHSQLAPTRLWGYEGHYPGPCFDVTSGEPIEVQWENNLPSQHLFAIDPHIHGAMPPTPTVRTVPHLHGSRTSSQSDGLPEKWFVPGESAHYSYPNNQRAATLWYHDHAVGITRLNVYAGLSGFYLLRDAEERSMQLPSGDYEIPLLLHDRTLDSKAQLAYLPTHEDGIELPQGVWGPEFFGNLPLVNGAIFPHLEVEPRPYRLRLLNAANSRFLNLFFNLAKEPTDIPFLVEFHQIGTDGGLLSKPAAMKKMLMGPAERADLIVDFSGLEGKTVTLSNDGSAPFPGWEMMTIHHAPLHEWMQFRVTLPLSATRKSILMAAPQPISPLKESDSVITRDFVLTEQVDASGRSLGVRINGKGYDDPVTEHVKLNSVEKWRFINTTDDAHPMHLHLVQFQILHRQGFDFATMQRGVVTPVGPLRPPAPNEAGWKDTAVVNPRDILTILARFEGFTGRYVFHCHMLEHEDNDMMRPYEVVS